MYQFWRITQRDAANLFFRPMWIFFALFFPLALTSIMGILLEGMFGNEVTSYDYYGITMMIYTVLYSATFAANSFLEERIKQANLRIIFAPVRKFSIPFSKVMATFLFTTFFYSLTGVILWLGFSINFGGSYSVYFWFLLLCLNFCCSSIGVFFCCIVKSEGVANQIISVVTTLLALLSSLLFPLRNINQFLADISQYSPLTPIVRTAFQIIYDHNLSGIFPVASWILAISCLFIGLSSYLFKGEDYL